MVEIVNFAGCCEKGDRAWEFVESCQGRLPSHIFNDVADIYYDSVSGWNDGEDTIRSPEHQADTIKRMKAYLWIYNYHKEICGDIEVSIIEGVEI